ncbi:class I SAM-dependent methyltransferase [Aureibacter tunicatorum]|uniref:SAM-dependent methyltransferase n=1 Tax=Aureibacter tunicatorum TaxID=866807 RepID=A0AAE3XMI9_9BACT|nr:class I SAM-dependent methyltransferase [Aureibacter tunicatorum]MDR6238516.1 SAM-dependent methyltransferase [Aureibacter tunicatorum]BDD05551.1 hypothetical protein AUTU_30340 [Aureibacter tunicatorum]
MKAEIIRYYDSLARIYDKDRFSNSYGKYIHSQELKVLNKYLSKKKIDKNLDLACGTGRFLDFAKYGADISLEMIKLSRDKFPSKIIVHGDAEELRFEDKSFENVYSFHLLMHLDLETLTRIQKEVSRICKANGLFIFDIPSEKRRRLFGFKRTSWHGGYQISYDELKGIINNDWEIVDYHGVAFFPIHRIPKKFRKLFIPLDTIFCNSIFKEYSSHLIFILKKK